MNVVHKLTPFNEIIDLMIDKDRELLEKTKYEVNYKAGEVIFKRGIQTTQLMFLTNGLAKSYIEGYNNRNLIIRLIKPYEIIGVLASFVGKQEQYSLMAVEDCNCCFYDLELYKEIARRNSKVYDKLPKTFVFTHCNIIQNLLVLPKSKLMAELLKFYFIYITKFIKKIHLH